MFLGKKFLGERTKKFDLTTMIPQVELFSKHQKDILESTDLQIHMFYVSIKTKLLQSPEIS